jgi:hypothetical protein
VFDFLTGPNPIKHILVLGPEALDEMGQEVLGHLNSRDAVSLGVTWAYARIEPDHLTEGLAEAVAQKAKRILAKKAAAAA